jgi:hypothetical protein
MAMPFSAYSLYAPPWTDIVREAALVAGDDDPAYPVTNAQNDDTADTAKALGLTDTIEVPVVGDPVEAIAAAVFNTNATEPIVVRSDDGLEEEIAIPDRTPDGKQRNGWIYLGDKTGRTSDKFYFDLAKTGSAVLEYGRLLIVTALLELVWLPLPEFGFTRPGALRNRTRLGKVHRRLSPVAAPRTGMGQFVDIDELDALLNLEAASNGLGQGFLLIPDRRKNDALFVQCGEDALRWRGGDSQIDLRLPLEEISMGLPPGLS